jgi:hypothetical protein
MTLAVMAEDRAVNVFRNLEHLVGAGFSLTLG